MKKGIRRGLSQAIRSYSKANNNYHKDFDPIKPENYLLYADANNLYEWALSQKLPYKDIMWTNPNNRALEEWKEEILELS